VCLWSMSQALFILSVELVFVTFRQPVYSTRDRSVYVIVSPRQTVEWQIQNELLRSASQGKVAIVPLERATAKELATTLRSLLVKTAGNVSIPYTTCLRRLTISEVSRIEDALRLLRRKGFTIYAASGNHGALCDPMYSGATYPAASSYVCAIGALRDGRPDVSSGRGPKLGGVRRTPDGMDQGVIEISGRPHFGTSVAVTRAAMRARPLIVSHFDVCMPR